MRKANTGLKREMKALKKTNDRLSTDNSRLIAIYMDDKEVFKQNLRIKLEYEDLI